MKHYIKPSIESKYINVASALLTTSEDLRTTNGQASHSYDILNKESVWDDGVEE